MRMDEIRRWARSVSVEPGRRGKAEVIRDIQRAEGNLDCFGKLMGPCDQIECAWREDCLQGPAQAPRHP